MDLALRDMMRCIEHALCYLARGEDIDWVLPRLERVLTYLMELPKGSDRDFIEGIRAFFVNYRDMYKRAGVVKKDAAANWARLVRDYRRHMMED